MGLLLGTLGFRSETLLPAIRAAENIEKVVFFHDGHESSVKAKSEVCSYCEATGLKAVPIKVDDAFDFMQMAKRIRHEVRRYRNEGAEIRGFNIAGGTRLMSSAALLVCILEGVPATYVHDKTLEPFPLPLLRMRYSDTLTTKQKEILKFLLLNRDKPLTEKQLADAIGVEKATINHHVGQLVEKGVVSLVPKAGDRRAKIVKVDEAMELLLE